MVDAGPGLTEKHHSLPSFIPGVFLLAVVPRQKQRGASGIHDLSHLLIF